SSSSSLGLEAPDALTQRRPASVEFMPKGVKSWTCANRNRCSPTRPASYTVTSNPRRVASRAASIPMGPAPMIAIDRLLISSKPQVLQLLLIEAQVVAVLVKEGDLDLLGHLGAGASRPLEVPLKE